MNKQELIKTLSDVLELLKQEPVAVNDKQLDDWADQIADSLSDAGVDAINDYELSMSYREVELTSIDFSHNYIKEMVKDIIKG